MQPICLVGNAHIDPAWLWRWQEGYSEVLSTFRSALDRIAEFDEFVFTCAGALYYQFAEETDPAMFREIRTAVKNGRWVIVGGQLIQPDCNLPCGESFARHGLLAQRYFEEKFGVRARVGYNVDSFGHSAMLPQILKKTGLDAYVFMRPSPGEYPFPFPKNTFLWVAPDGTGIPASRILHYTCDFDKAAERIGKDAQTAEQNKEPMMSFYGVGNHGGGPTVAMIRALTALKLESEDGQYRFSSPNDFFTGIKPENLPVLSGDLLHHASGCYSALMEIKAMNIRAEAALLSAEKADMAAVLAGLSASPASLSEAWIPTLFNQFHDILGGCTIRRAAEDAVAFFGKSIATAAVTENRALQKILWQIDTSAGNRAPTGKTDTVMWETSERGAPAAVFNLNAFSLRTPVRFSREVASVTDENGTPVPLASVRSGVTNQKEKYETEILADLPSFGYRLYWLRRGKGEERQALRPVPVTPKKADAQGTPAPVSAENRSLSVGFDQKGVLCRLTDKKRSLDLLCGGISLCVMDETHCDTWAHGVFAFDREVGRMEPTDFRAEQTPISEIFTTRYVFGRSSLLLRVTLYPETDEVFLDCKVDWHEEHRVLKLCIPTAFPVGERVAVPFGFTDRRADGKEHPMGRWLLLSDGKTGLGVATDTRTAYDCRDGLLRLTLLRSPLYADHFGERDDACEFTEQGVQEFRAALLLTDRDPVRLSQMAQTLVSPPAAYFTTYHKGALPEREQFLEITAPNIALTAFKGAEDGNGYVLRCHEVAGRSARTEIRIPRLGLAFKANFGAQEIKTFYIDAATRTVRETDLTEAAVPFTTAKRRSTV